MTSPRASSGPRLAPLDRDDLDAAAQELFDQIAITRGGMPTSFRVFLNSPAAASAIADLGTYVRFGAPLPPRVLELVVMRVAADLQDPFMWAHHTGFAAAAGITPEELAALRLPGPFTSPDGSTGRLVAFIDAVVAHSMTDEVFAAAQGDLGPALTMDLTLAVGFYVMQHALFSALRLDSPTDSRVALSTHEPHGGTTTERSAS